MKILSRYEMEKLTTPRLLAYKNSLLTCRDDDEADEEDPYCRPGKLSDMWKRCYEECLTILSTREHVDRKKKKR